MKKQLKWKEGAPLRAALRALAHKRSMFDKAGKQLLVSCDGTIFPADVYFIATCNRALQNFDAFQKVMSVDYYSTAMILLRVQLDSVLRCHGLRLTGDPHGAANEVMNGKKLGDLKAKDTNEKLSDGYLKKTFAAISPANEIVTHIYDLSSGYVHLSSAAIDHVLGQTKTTSTGQTQFYIGSEEALVPQSGKLQLVQAFDRVTEAFLGLAGNWAADRHKFGEPNDLYEKYGPKKAQ